MLTSNEHDTSLDELADYFDYHVGQEREESVDNMISYELNYEEPGNIQPNNFVYVMMTNGEYSLDGEWWT